MHNLTTAGILVLRNVGIQFILFFWWINIQGVFLHGHSLGEICLGDDDANDDDHLLLYQLRFYLCCEQVQHWVQPFQAGLIQELPLRVLLQQFYLMQTATSTVSIPRYQILQVYQSRVGCWCQHSLQVSWELVDDNHGGDHIHISLKEEEKNLMLLVDFKRISDLIYSLHSICCWFFEYQYIIKIYEIFMQYCLQSVVEKFTLFF